MMPDYIKTEQLNEEVEASLELLLNEFDRDLQQLNKDKFKIASNINQIRKIETSLGQGEDSHDQRAKLNAQIEVTKEMIRQTSEAIQSLVKKAESLPEDRRMRLKNFSREYSSLLEAFQRQQHQALETTKGFIQQAQSIQRQSREDDVETPLLTQAQKQLIPGRLENEISYNQAIAVEREHGIQEIEATMTEIHEIFKDIGVIVAEQGDLFDHIEVQMELAAQRTSRAGHQLRIAEDYRRKSSYKCCWMLFLVLLISTIVISIIISI